MMRENIEIKGYHIERLSKKNVHSLNMLHNIVHGKPQEAGYFAKKYDTAYTGVEYTGYIAFDGRQLPIAYYGVIPCFIRDGDHLYLAAQSADTMIHPKYRFKGLFVQLANLTFDLCAEEGVSIIFGFPNQHSLYDFLSKLKWQFTETMNCYIIPVSIIPMGLAISRIPFLNTIYYAYQQRTLKKYLQAQKGIENSVFKDGFAGVNRNGLYLNYKTCHRTQVIKIGESLLWIKTDNGLIIGDINCKEEDFEDMMNELSKIAFRLGLTEIRFHTSHQTTLSALFAARYNAVPSFHVLFKNMSTHIPMDKIKFTFADTDLF